MTLEEAAASRATRRGSPATIANYWLWQAATDAGSGGSGVGSRVSGVRSRVSGVGLALLLVLLAACSGDSAVTTTVEVTTTASTTTGPAATSPDPLAAFARSTVLVAGDPWEVAVADTPALRSQGLMGVTDLGDLSGMLFVFAEDTGAGFWMKDTLIPLDVAFFAADGSLVDLVSMVPCVDDDCPTHHASDRYRYALEAPPGGFDGLDPLQLVVPGG